MKQLMVYICDVFTDNAEDRKLCRTVSMRPGDI